ncbi:MAG TPA: FAD-dependent oxidoreductase [Acidobacteriota bacterium]|nr:FAD-dependent oxidoreductase [Acidobacteriota bacterium]
MSKKIVIVGGVAGGASCAARARRMCESCRIVVFDRGPYVSFANCGLPYYVGDVISDEARLLVASPELFKERFNIEVRTLSEVLSIDPRQRLVEVKDLSNDETYQESYDALVLSPGAAPIRPQIPGIDLAGIFSLRTIPDSRRIRDWLNRRSGSRGAVIVGAGFIGMEMAENLARRGLPVTIIEKARQILPSMDPEMTKPVEEHIRSQGVELILNDGLARFEELKDGLKVVTESGRSLEAGLVILAMGVRPETALAREAGLELGSQDAIRVDQQMRTSDPNIWAVGDAVEVRHVVSGTPQVFPLAGPANRQGRVAADSILERPATFRGAQSTAVCGIFDMVVAQTGASEKGLRAEGVEDFACVYLHPGHHVGYYPGARPIHLKLLFSRPEGKLLGAQAVGEEGVERRIDTIAMALQMGAGVFDLEEAELCYAPQFGAAKDPVNMAGMVAANHLRGDLPLADWRRLAETNALLVDVREPKEYQQEHIPRSVNLPLSQLRHRMEELPKDREIWIICMVGQRAYYAVRALRQCGYDAKNLSGGLQTYRYFKSLWPDLQAP